MTEGVWLLSLVLWTVTVVLVLLIWFDLRQSLQAIHQALRIVPATEQPQSESFAISEHEEALLEQEQMRQSEERAVAIASRRSGSSLPRIR